MGALERCAGGVAGAGVGSDSAVESEACCGVAVAGVGSDGTGGVLAGFEADA